MFDCAETFASAGVREDPLFGTAYRSISILGRGGMGTVIEAEHLALAKRVVVKLVHAHLANDPRFVDRLRVEARSLSLIEHPNVVAVSDLGRTPRGRPYLVMERLQGRTLEAELTARGALPAREAIAVVRQVLAGLEAAHALGIVHRDVKTANVFRCDGGRVKLLDFGVAKIVHEEAAPRVLAREHPTADGMVVGSPRFVAPEQVRGAQVDARTDIYGAGALLYALLAGRSPFAHLDDLPDLLQAHLSEPPAPPSAYAPAPIPHELERAVLKALAKAPAERFQSAAAFAAELERVAAALPSEPPPPHDTQLLPAPAMSFAPTAVAIPVVEATLARDPGSDAALVRGFAVATLASAVLASVAISLVFLLLGGVR